MYTTHGLMIGGDYAEYLKDTDQGTTVVYTDNPPEWFAHIVTCPCCATAVADHESFTVSDASGGIISCSLSSYMEFYEDYEQ